MNKRYIRTLAAFFAVLILLAGCGSTSNTNDLTAVSTRDYYCKEDFESIIIGESTYKDVYNIAPPESVPVASYGVLCEYPMQNGGCLRIKCCGKDLIVDAIEEVSPPQEMDTSHAFVQGFSTDNETPLVDLLKRSYERKDLTDFFGEIPPNECLMYETVANQEKLHIKAVNERFPIECIRHNGGIGYYSIYKVTNGGYFYVFWSLTVPSQDGLDSDGRPDDATVYFATYIATPPKALDFSSILEGTSTAEDVAQVDPAFELSFTFSSTVRSYSLLDDGSILEITYKPVEPIRSRKDLVVERKTIVSDAQSGSCLAAIYPEDLP